MPAVLKGAVAHGHHIVQKVLPSAWKDHGLAVIKTEAELLRKFGGENQKSIRRAWYIGKSQEMLANGNISLIETLEDATKLVKAKQPLNNLCWARMGGGTGIHSEAYCKRVWEYLHATDGSKIEITKALDNMATIFEKDGTFWPKP